MLKWFSRKPDKGRDNSNSSNQPHTFTKEKEDNPYFVLRDHALQAKPEDINLSLENGEQVYCAVVDICATNAIATLVCMFDGTVSLYYSNGGGMLGLGHAHETVRKAGMSFLVSAGQTLSALQVTQEFPLPTLQNESFVYLLARDGIYKASFNMSNPTAKGRECAFLNHLIQSVLTSIRESGEIGR